MEMKIIKYCIWSPKMFKPVKFYTEKGRVFFNTIKIQYIDIFKMFFPNFVKMRDVQNWSFFMKQ